MLLDDLSVMLEKVFKNFIKIMTQIVLESVNNLALVKLGIVCNVLRLSAMLGHYILVFLMCDNLPHGNHPSLPV